MSTTINSNYLTSLFGVTPSTYVSPTQGSTQGTSDPLLQDTNSSSQGSATDVLLSDAAKAYLAGTGDTAPAPALPLATLAANARAWFDEQYKAKNITSPIADGTVALDLSGQSRESLIAIATNAQNLFSDDEKTAATRELQARFKDAVSPYVAIARKTGNYAALYQAASDYLDKAGPNERATQSWQDAKKAVVDGLAAAKAHPGQAPALDNPNDPVSALLAVREASDVDPSASADALAANARAMLDDQANAAADAGSELVFNASETSGQLVDFSKFDNRTLAIVALNTGPKFSDEEAAAAKTELNQRTRTTMLSVLNPSSGAASGVDINLGLLRTYENMSDEERSALGVTESVTNRLIQNYQTMQSLQSAFTGSALNPGMMGMSALLSGGSDGGSGGGDISMGLAGLM